MLAFHSVSRCTWCPRKCTVALQGSRMLLGWGRRIWVRRDFEGPDFAGFRLHALQAAVVVVCFVAQKAAGAVAGAFYVEAV
jgi:hypothetical protein